MTTDRNVEFYQGRAWIEIDRAALKHNVGVLRSRLPEGCVLMPAIKANAYGHGSNEIAHECQRLGINAFCVATVQEGIELRNSGIDSEVLILGYTSPWYFPYLHQYHLTQTVLDLPYALELNSCGYFLKVHIKVDTGMHRLGEPWTSPEDIAQIFRCRNLRMEGMFTHICCVDMAEEQGRRFYQLIDTLRDKGCPLPPVHLLSSYGLLTHPELGGSYARVGIALYGTLSNRADTERYGLDLRPVLTMKARVAQVRELEMGESAGYDLMFTAKRHSKLAVLTIGYADGLPRSLSCGIGAVLLHGHKAPIAGRICMDQTLVDVTDVPEVSPGDVAVLIGQDSGQTISACDVAEQAGTISNEILSRLGGRLERVVI